MGKKCLILYASFSGNTEKVAQRIKETFEKHDWQCDMFKVRKNADDILRPPYDIRQYDFVCIGSGLRAHLPYNEVLNVIRGQIWGFDPRITLGYRDETIPYITEPVHEIPPDKKDPRKSHGKIVLTPDSPKAITFITYGGYEFGPIEADPAARILALDIMHMGFECIGHFCCPGMYLNDPTPRAFHGDIRGRPNEKDLLKAQMFIEEKLEEIADRT